MEQYAGSMGSDMEEPWYDGDDIMALDMGVVEGEAQEEDEYGFEDANEVAMVENADKVVAETLPIRCVSELNISDADHPALSVSVAPPTEDGSSVPQSTSRSKQIRHKKSVRFNKGGAFHAHTFSKSVGKV